MQSRRRTCERVGAQILSPEAAIGGLVGGFEGAGDTAQEEGKRTGPWLWQEWPCGAAAAEGGRHLNRLEGTRLEGVVLEQLEEALVVRRVVLLGVCAAQKGEREAATSGG